MFSKTIILLTAFVVLIIAMACNSGVQIPQVVAVSKDSLIKRGNYLVTAMGCEDCHSTKKLGPHGPEIDSLFRFGGHIASTPVPPIKPGAGQDGWVLMAIDQTMAIGPWGTSYAANISSDATGIGNWTMQQFFTAMRKGKSKGLENARTLLPPMPWPNYTHLSNLDMQAIFEYLKSNKPVNNVVPLPQPPIQAKS